MRAEQPETSGVPGRGIADIIRRRKWLAASTATAVMVAAASLTYFLPDLYVSTATVLIEGQQIPSQLVQSTVTGALETRLQTINQEILSRSRLESLIERFGLYPTLRGRVPMEQLIERMRRDIRLELKGEGQKKGAKTTIAFLLSYSGRDAQKAAAVTNTLASFYIEENLKARERQAAGTAEFLETQLQEMKRRLEEQEKHVGRFKESHMGELPQQLGANLATLERLNGQLRLNSDNQAKVIERRSVLEAQLAEAEAASTPTGPTALAQRLDQLQKQLAALRARYSDKYPDVVRIKADIAALEEELRNPSAQSAGPQPSLSPQVLQLRKAIQDADVEYKALRTEADSLRASLATYQRRVESAPRREQEYEALARDYETTKELYRSLLARQQTAEVGESMEQRQKGEQFRVIEPAVAAETPAAPNRVQLLLIGLFVALAMGGAAVLLAEQLDTSFHSLDELRAFSGFPVILGIPPVVTPRDRRRRRLRFGLKAVSVMTGYVILGVSSYLLAQRSEQFMGILLR